jgi:hypothetical protein
MADETVNGEPVSGAQFPVIREKTGNFAELLAEARKRARISKQIRSVTAKFPARRNRELLSLEQGILSNRTGNVLAQSGNHLCSQERI